jgi:LytS/YehU family sensor histidine kinase
MGVNIQLFEVGLTPLDFRLWGWMKSEVYKEKVNTRDELVVRIMNSAALIKQERQDDLRRGIRTIAKRVEKYFGVDGGIFEHLL